MEITGRAMAFWAYQVSSERAYQERAARKALDHAEETRTKVEVAMATALKQKEGKLKFVKNIPRRQGVYGLHKLSHFSFF